MRNDIPILNEVPSVAEVELIALLRDAFIDLANSQAIAPPTRVVVFPDGSDAITYQGYLNSSRTFGTKISPYIVRPNGKPVVTAWTLLMSIETGEPILLVNSKSLTALRTAATTALAVDLLAAESVEKLAIIGTGPIALEHFRFVSKIRNFSNVRVWSPNANPHFCSENFGEGALAESKEQAIENADVILLCTSAAEPLIDLRELPSGTLVTSISTNAPDAHEVEPASLQNASIYVDSRTDAFAGAGEFKIANREHGFRVDDIRGELADLVSARIAPEFSGVRYFRSVGLGLEDVVIAGLVLKNLEEQK